ncbi:MAG: DHH family phosphoesterase, partial [Bacteroidaceae bacterium]|nr:DHH family phosphoesterase [Bacteroidaceae bacterium]
MERLLDDTQIERFLGMIDEAKRIVICAHVNPDGDAIGSSLALKHWLARRGKEAQVVVPNMFPDFLQWMPGAQDIRVYFKHEEEVRPVLEAADLFLVADMNEPGRLREMETDFMANDVPRIMIDHHLNP